MSLIVGGLVAGVLVAALGATAAILGRRRRARALLPPPGARLTPTGLIAEGFEADVGDVISLDRREYWLEDAWLLRETEPVAAVCFARDVVLVLFPQPSEICYRLEEIPFDAVNDPPNVVEYQGQRYERRRRRPLLVEARGDASPPFREALLVEYDALADGVLWLLLGREQQHAWCGQRCSMSQFERWGPAEPRAVTD